MIEELKRFIAVTKNRHITKTAQELFITQSTLSQSIQRLEKELNTRLVIYKGKQLQITSEGETVLMIGAKIVDLWEKLHDQKIQTFAGKTVTIGMFDNAALLLGDFFQNDVHVKDKTIELTIDSSSQLVTKLQLGILDIALFVLDSSKKIADYKDVISVAEFAEELLPVSSKVFSLPLSEIPLILYNKDSHTRKQIDAVFKKNNINPYVFVESTSPTYMKELAKLGSGVTFLPYNFISEELKQKQLFIQNIPIKIYRKYGIFVNKNSSKYEKKVTSAIAVQLQKKVVFTRR